MKEKEVVVCVENQARKGVNDLKPPFLSIRPGRNQNEEKALIGAAGIIVIVAYMTVGGF